MDPIIYCFMHPRLIIIDTLVIHLKRPLRKIYYPLPDRVLNFRRSDYTMTNTFIQWSPVKWRRRNENLKEIDKCNIGSSLIVRKTAQAMSTLFFYWPTPRRFFVFSILIYPRLYFCFIENSQTLKFSSHFWFNNLFVFYNLITNKAWYKLNWHCVFKCLSNKILFVS